MTSRVPPRPALVAEVSYQCPSTWIAAWSPAPARPGWRPVQALVAQQVFGGQSLGVVLGAAEGVEVSVSRTGSAR